MKQSKLVSQSWDRPLEPPQSLPESTDVVVIGGGIVGAATAWQLAKRGVSVTLCEKGLTGAEQSGRNWGWVRTMVRDPRELPMMLESMRLWDELQADFGDVGFNRSGCMLLATSDSELQSFANWLPTAVDFGLDTRIIDGNELDKYVSNGSKHWRGALYSASDGRAEPHLATRVVVDAARASGAVIAESTAVRGLETTAGRVSGVVTEHGSIKTSTVLCAAGAWTSLFCRSLGIALPQLKVKGTVARLAAGAGVIEGNAYDPRLGIRRRSDGGYTVAHGFALNHSITPATFRFALKFLPALKLEFSKLRVSIGRDFFDELFTPSSWALDGISPFETQRILNPAADLKQIAAVRQTIDELFPALADCDIVESWAGIVETTPDVVPVMCESEKVPGFFIATGFSGHGFGLGPGAGKAAADMLLNADDALDLSSMRLQRFFDGSKISPQESI